MILQLGIHIAICALQGGNKSHFGTKNLEGCALVRTCCNVHDKHFLDITL